MDELDKLALLGVSFWLGAIMYSFTWYEQEEVLTKNEGTLEDYIINE